MTGILGQDGRHLAQQLDSLGYEVIGVSKNFDDSNSEYVGLQKTNEIIAEDLSIPSVADSILNRFKPEKIFHMAGVHASSPTMTEFGKVAFQEMYNCHVGITKNILEWQTNNLHAKSVIALSSQMYSPVGDITIISEESTPNPSSQYGDTKLAAFDLIKRFRIEHKCKSAGAILFNHTSHISKGQFLFPLLAQQICDLLEAKRDDIQILNANALVDMSSAEEVCRGIISMSDNNPMGDMIFSSGKLETVRSIIEKVLVQFSITLPVRITSTNEAAKPGRVLLGDPSRALEILDWKPEKTPADILYEMVNALRMENA